MVRQCIAVALSCLAFATPAVAGTKVVVNDAGILVIDGKPVFPISFTMPPPPDGKTPDGGDAFAEIAAAGATFLRTGPWGHNWDDATWDRERRWLDAAAKHGLYCMPNLRESAAVPPGEKGREREALLRKLVNAFKDHPGLGAWKSVDEPDWGKVPVEDMRRATRIIRELDPNHPIWVVQAPRGTIESMRAYDDTYDITGVDIYPIGYPPGTHSLLPNKEISMVGDYTRMMREVAGQKPVWMVLQASWSGVLKPGRTLRMPTFPEQRFMTYQAIINGARGVKYFGISNKMAMSPADAELGWNWTHWRRVLRPVIEEIGSHSPLYPALLAPESPITLRVSAAPVQTFARAGSEAATTAPAIGAAATSDGPPTPNVVANVEWCVREVGDHVFVLVCKREGATVNVQFDGLPKELTDGEVMFESPRRARAENGRFTDWFAPFEVHVYRFRSTKS